MLPRPPARTLELAIPGWRPRRALAIAYGAPSVDSGIGPPHGSPVHIHRSFISTVRTSRNGGSGVRRFAAYNTFQVRILAETIPASSSDTSTTSTSRRMSGARNRVTTRPGRYCLRQCQRRIFLTKVCNINTFLFSRCAGKAFSSSRLSVFLFGSRLRGGGPPIPPTIL